MLAIVEHEGWSAESVGTPPGGSRAYRNHNPGNLRASPFACGTSGGYATFKNDLIGWNALQWDLLQKAKGNTTTGLGPSSTLRDLIFKYAPPSDGNDSEKYLTAVCLATGIAETATLQEIIG